MLNEFILEGVCEYAAVYSYLSPPHTMELCQQNNCNHSFINLSSTSSAALLCIRDPNVATKVPGDSSAEPTTNTVKICSLEFSLFFFSYS